MPLLIKCQMGDWLIRLQLSNSTLPRWNITCKIVNPPNIINDNENITRQ